MTNRKRCGKIKNNRKGALAQLGAHNTGSVGVRGSNPLRSTKKSPRVNRAGSFWFFCFRGSNPRRHRKNEIECNRVRCFRMRGKTEKWRNECAVESRKKNPDRYCDPGSGAGNQSRTDDLVITNDVLYQLSHASKIVVFSVDPTIISNFSPFVNPFLKIFLRGSGEDLGGREPPLERWGSLPPNLPHSPKTSPKCTRPCSEKI